MTRDPVPTQPSPEGLRAIAWALDRLTDLTLPVMESIIRGDNVNAGEITLTLTLERDGGGDPLTPDDARRLREWVSGDEMQRDLRSWADEIEASSARPVACAACRRPIRPTWNWWMDEQGWSHCPDGKPHIAAYSVADMPSLHDLWRRAGEETGDTAAGHDSSMARAVRYRELMKEHGHLVPNDCSCGCHDDPPSALHSAACQCQRLPCGWPGPTRSSGQSRSEDT